MSEIHVLIVDDEEALVRSLSYALRGEGMLPRAVYSGEAALELLADSTVGVDIVLLDLGLPGMDGIATLEGLRKCRPELPVIMISAHGDTRAAVQAVKGGATDYLTKPFELDDLLATIHNTLAVPPSDEVAVAEQGALLGQSPAMRGLQAAVQRIANSSATRILLLGESGTGKTLVAQALHANSARSAHPFIEVNCAALPEQLIEAELFGSEKGSYTGAHQKRVGLVTQANNGTLFLDEIGELPLALQAKLLHFLENGSYRAVGASQASSADVRVVAATNRDLADDVRQGRFREDLFYRLNVITIDIPALRERDDDILLLARHFAARQAQEEKAAPIELQADAAAALVRHRWPGNVRELKNLIERLTILLPGQAISAVQLPAHLHSSEPAPTSLSALDDQLERAERELVNDALSRSAGHKGLAADLLGISRHALKRRLQRLGL
ncbi:MULTISPECIES: sigma-54-dependent transcriptional regulator [unclassified Pseudomonas]|uniref:sigma-54-dependent transcriptional regulator n=1 Tax=unclassified Pseudomonas TaxID=196821 RepID=UPI0021C9A870|nr:MULTISPECIES: sigma-54 dependent transcriptional regulator [unclassified Pseudomonas]MCU1730758.1 sigma-54 dependent transcriptional regulator [Pseudomonas sp. 20P_3.2_Bac4]MCU1742896.1 sigma-54 dependent transcriptional regulator [Pseudomonas sp. 20P_3.2_Bac5]